MTEVEGKPEKRLTIFRVERKVIFNIWLNPPPPQRLVHFDLKGAPPKVDYLKKVLKLSAGLGATGVLMEYEDMFPFTGKLGKAAAANHYSADEVRELLDECQALGLTVIPLVQTFGE